jgi:hypothetical protein
MEDCLEPRAIRWNHPGRRAEEPRVIDKCRVLGLLDQRASSDSPQPLRQLRMSSRYVDDEVGRDLFALHSANAGDVRNSLRSRRACQQTHDGDAATNGE